MNFKIDANCSYIEKQIKPIANDVLPFIEKSFEVIVSKQINLF